jgi:hypothetical protein
MRRALILVAALAAALVLAPLASATIGDERALAEKFSPVVRLVEQPEPCGPGEPYEPMDVNALFGQATVALRGPWNRTDLVRIGPTARDLAGLYEYHLDFPGDPLDPGCGYEEWSRLLTEGKPPTAYAHVATDPAHPGKLALQYWLFYAFNDFNNLHEGVWEMIQLDFDAPDARSALGTTPYEVGYSSHEGAERAHWGDGKLELVDGTHPVVYPAAGSHANKYTEALYVGSSAEAGVGCDDTRGAHRELRPAIVTIPHDPAAAASELPWITFRGRWGELQPAFFNGPTGPNLKTQWTEPITWAESWRDRSYAVPTGGVLGTDATDFFCTAVAKGSRGLVQLIRSPLITLIALGTMILFGIWLARRTRWRPVAPLRLARRRTWGQILSASARMYVRRLGLFFGIGLLLIPLSVVITILQAALLGGFGLLGLDVTGESAGALVLLVVGLGTVLALFGFVLVQGATARALVEIDAGRDVGPLDAYRRALRSLRPLLGGLAAGVAVWLALTTTAFLTPVAVWLVVRWLLLAQAVELEGLTGVAGLRRSARLVRGGWFRVASLVGVGALLALAIGPFLGALLILLTDAPLALLNVVAGLFYALAMPFVAIVTSYVYVDRRARLELAEGEAAVRELPAEIELAT